MSKLYLSFFTFLFFGIMYNPIYSQIQEGQYINASVGFGMCAPYDDEADITGSGFYAQGEYVWNLTGWFGVRPYAGVVIASGESEPQEIAAWKIKSNAALLGAKFRLAAPIPYVAPFIESGIGMSIGSFETYTPNTSLKESGVLLHIPLSLGLAVGRKHNYEVKFTYYYHDAVKQFSGAAALGFSFPLDDNDK